MAGVNGGSVVQHSAYVHVRKAVATTAVQPGIIDCSTMDWILEQPDQPVTRNHQRKGE